MISDAYINYNIDKNILGVEQNDCSIIYSWL